MTMLIGRTKYHGQSNTPFRPVNQTRGLTNEVMQIPSNCCYVGQALQILWNYVHDLSR